MDEDGGKRFPRTERLRNRKEFLRVYERGAKVRTKLFFIYVLENDLPYSRMGITVSRKVGKTNIRNQLKRRLREVFRKHKSVVTPPSDVVINTSRVTAGATYAQLEADFVKIFVGDDGAGDGCGS